MYDFENMDKRLIIFANTFLSANRLQTLLDKEMGEITSKQWLAIVMLDMFEKPPTLKELAKQCDTSHQNTKQIVLKLQAKGYVTIEKDEKDGRAMRIVKLPKIDEWGMLYEERSIQFISEMFSDLTQEEIQIMCEAQMKIYNRLGQMKNSEEK